MNRLQALFQWRLIPKFLMIFMLLVILPITSFGYLLLQETNAVMETEAVETTVRITNTIENNMISLIRDVQDISSYIIFSNDFRKLLTASNDSNQRIGYTSGMEQINGFLTFQLMSKNYISSIELYSQRGKVLEMGEPLTGNEEEWSREAKVLAGAYIWTGSYKLTSLWNNKYKDVISLFRQINDLHEMNQRIGEVRIRLKEDQLYRMISSGINPELGHIFILDDNGTIVVHQDKNLLGQQYPDEQFRKRFAGRIKDRRSFNFVFEGNETIAVVRKIRDTDWNLVAIVHQSGISENLEGLRVWLLRMIVVSAILGFLALIGFYWIILRPILELIKETRRVEGGDFTAQVKVRSSDEIGMLGEHFNRMVNRIQRLIETKLMLEIKQKESELKALQSQIDPHFLYNTLDMIRWTARLEQAMKTSKLIEALSRLFRMNLSGGKLWIPLRDELTYVVSYLELQRERLGGELSFSVFMEAGLELIQVPKQTLQPLVENSIVHGFKGRNKGNRVTIRCYIDADHLVMEVSDNGIGFVGATDRETFRKQFFGDGEGFALKNINERLLMAFGSPYGLEYVQGKEKGATILIRMPLQPEVSRDGEKAVVQSEEFD